MRKKYQKPSYKKGGQTKEQWISDKISEIMGEGKVKQDQAIAMAFSMYDQQFQKGGTSKMFNYDKVGNKSITDIDVNKINKATGIQFTPEFAKEYYSTQVNPPTNNNNQIQMPSKAVMDITMGLHGSRNIWNVRPETLIGKEPKEGVDYYVVPPKSWESYQKSPEYLNYIKSTSDGLAYMKQGGELPMYQFAGRFRKDASNNMMTQPSTTIRNPEDVFNANYGVPTTFNINSNNAQTPVKPFTGYGLPTPKTPWEISGVTNKNYGLSVTASSQNNQITPATTPTNQTTSTPTAIQPSPSSFTLPKPQIPTDASMEEIVTPENNNPAMYDTEKALQGEMLTDWGNNLNTVTPESNLTQSTISNNISSPQPFQFDNYFNGVSIPASAAFLGQSIKNKDTLGTVVGGLKLATGLGRSFMAGYGQANVQDEIMKNYTDSQRDTVTQANRPRVMQEGGEIVEGQPEQQGGQEEQIFQMIAGALQQGASPEEVLQMLVEQGLPQEQAVQMVEMVMQQLGGAQQEQQPTQEEQPMMQSGGILNTLKGKRIVDYKYNEKTGNYDVQYED